MLKQIWRWVSLFPLLHPVWFNLLLLVLAWSLVGVAYQSNDDLVIASVLTSRRHIHLLAGLHACVRGVPPVYVSMLCRQPPASGTC